MTSINLQRDVVLLPLQAVSGVVERRHTLPILSNVLVELQDGVLSLTATDLEIQVCCRAQTDMGMTREATSVSARKLQDILRALPEGSSLSVDLQEKRMQLKAGKSKFALQTLPARDFPKLAAADGSTGRRLDVSQKALKRLFGLVHYSMAQQDIRYYLNGLLLSLAGNDLTLVATDGHRLAWATMPIEAEQAKIEVILPRKAALEVWKLLSETDSPVQIEIRENQVAFTIGSVELISKVVDGKFPDFQKVIPSGYKRHFTLERQSLQQALQRAAILSNEKFRGVRWLVSETNLRIISSNTEQEEAEEELEIEFSGGPVDIGFNVSYLLDVLANVSADRIDFWLGDANSSMLVTVPDDPSFKYVVMPMRI